MTRLILGCVDYQRHTTDEGDQFQRGLEHAGWILAGAGYGDGCRDVRELVQRYEPEIVVTHDKRDWSPDSPGSFRKDIGYENLGYLAERPDIFRACVLKDAGSVTRYQRNFFLETKADAAVVYYDPLIVRRLNPWLGRTMTIRTYHSVDSEICRRVAYRADRKRAVISGATSHAYPLRTRLMHHALTNPSERIAVFGHPGYGNGGSHTPAYLEMLSGYRVHVATASRFGFALRKLVESVAIGATPVTNLPAHDVLPEIDGALVRIPPTATIEQAVAAVAEADAAWNLEERLAWAEKAWRFYDWRAIGIRLSGLLEVAACERAIAEVVA